MYLNNKNYFIDEVINVKLNQKDSNVYGYKRQLVQCYSSTAQLAQYTNGIITMYLADFDICD